MWYHNLVILILYVILFHIFICSVEWYNNVFGLDDIVNPFSLNSKQLRLLLHVRGIFDAGIVDKQDLIQLADASDSERSSIEKCRCQCIGHPTDCIGRLPMRSV
uniref:Uncharacterized protein n=1 Tax=Romanomermis culicivorax TaxID=13658 RepID=A0A915HVJ4_ROMCU